MDWDSENFEPPPSASPPNTANSKWVGEDEDNNTKDTRKDKEDVKKDQPQKKSAQSKKPTSTLEEAIEEGERRERAKKSKPRNKLQKEITKASVRARGDSIAPPDTTNISKINTIYPDQKDDKKSNIIISGVPVKPDEDLKEIVERLANILEVELKDSDIIATDRLASIHKIPKIIVKLSEPEKRVKLIQRARRLNPSTKLLGLNLKYHRQISINEHLTQENTILLKKANALRQDGLVKSVWTKDGDIFVREHDKSPEIKITSEDIIKKIKSAASNPSISTTTDTISSELDEMNKCSEKNQPIQTSLNR